MLTYRSLIKAFQSVGLSPESRVILHVSLPSLGEITGGFETLVGSILASAQAVITPTFTTQAMIIPPFGPEGNALDYHLSNEEESIGESFNPDLPSDPDLGEIAEIIRCHPKAGRSQHPLLSFAGVNADEILFNQSLDEPWMPIKWLADADADVLLLGADHAKNVSLHYAEFLSGRKQFVRWALWEGKVVEVPHWPGCSNGFQQIEAKLEGVVREFPLGNATLQAIPMRDLINIASGWIREDPEAMLCQEPGCIFCEVVRASHPVSSSP